MPSHTDNGLAPTGPTAFAGSRPRLTYCVASGIQRLERELGTPLFTRTARPRESLFPAWALSQQQALEQAGVHPPSIDLEDTDLAATRWLHQPRVGWIMLIPSLAGAHTATVIKPVEHQQLMPFTLQWSPDRAQITAVARFVHTVHVRPREAVQQLGHSLAPRGTAGRPAPGPQRAGRGLPGGAGRGRPGAGFHCPQSME
jgi:hypothetical protein